MIKKEITLILIILLMQSYFIGIMSNVYAIENIEIQQINQEEAKETIAEVKINSTNLSTIKKNENVEITVLLKKDSTEMQLCKNSIIEIEFPEYIQEIEIKDIKLLFSDEIKIAESTLEENSRNKKIYIRLLADQTNFNIETIAKGLMIQILVDLTADKMTPTKEGEIKISYYTNENEDDYKIENNENICATVPVKFIAPTGLATIQSISNYAVGEVTVQSMNGEEQVGKIEKQSEEVNADVSITIMNNYNNPVNNIRVLGRIPFKGNKTITNGQDLGTTFDCLLQTPIESQEIDKEQVIIYYSENGEATEDLNNVDNGWKTENIDFSKIKSYLIVLPNHTMNTGDVLNFKYTVQIPQQLQKNESAFSTYIVYFDNQQNERIIQDRSMATRVGISTGEGPMLEAIVSSNIPEDQTVKEGQIITYKVTVKNTGNIINKDVIVTAPIPEGTFYIEYKNAGPYSEGEFVENKNKKSISWVLNTIEPGQSITNEYQVKIDKIVPEQFCTEPSHYVENDITGTHIETFNHNNDEYKVTINNTVTIFTDSIENIIKSNTVQNHAVRGYLSVQIVATPDNTSNIMKNGNITYKIKVENITDKTQKNVVLKMKIPQGTSFENAYIIDKNGVNTQKAIYNTEDNCVVYDVGDIEYCEFTNLRLQVQVIDLMENQYKEEIKAIAIATCDESQDIYSNEIVHYREMAQLNIKQIASIPTETTVYQGDKLTYTAIIKNESNVTANEVNIINEILEELQYIKSSYQVNNENPIKGYQEIDGLLQIKADIPAGGTLTLNIEAKVIGESGEKIKNIIKVSGYDIHSIESNEIIHNIITKEGSKNEENSAGKGNYQISGMAWLDENNNGEKEEGEKRLEGIIVFLINSETGEFIKNEAGERIITKTSNNGTYSFINLEPGKYNVVFLYNSSQYLLTQYRKKGISEENNSDAVLTTLEINGEKEQGGITEKIEIIDSNLYNLDIGLISKNKFDLKLEKYVSRITVQNKTGIKTYEYNDTKVAKRELIATQLNNTNLIIEYKFKITNEGEIEGFAKKILDYFPKELKFYSELNPNWYTDNLGNVYNSSLENQIIKPGETRELTLIATKKMTEENIGNISNTAEIYESSNEFGIADIDSTPGNKAQGEDDMSSADIILSIRTGKIITYITLITSIMGIVGIGTYLIKNKVIKK